LGVGEPAAEQEHDLPLEGRKMVGVAEAAIVVEVFLV
jgi:hypothetical protein